MATPAMGWPFCVYMKPIKPNAMNLITIIAPAGKLKAGAYSRTTSDGGAHLTLRYVGDVIPEEAIEPTYMETEATLIAMWPDVVIPLEEGPVIHLGATHGVIETRAERAFRILEEEGYMTANCFKWSRGDIESHISNCGGNPTPELVEEIFTYVAHAVNGTDGDHIIEAVNNIIGELVRDYLSDEDDGTDWSFPPESN